MKMGGEEKWTYLQNTDDVDITIRMENGCESFDILILGRQVDGDDSLEGLSLLFFRRITGAVVSGCSVVMVVTSVLLSGFELFSLVLWQVVRCTVSRSKENTLRS